MEKAPNPKGDAPRSLAWPGLVARALLVFSAIAAPASLHAQETIAVPATTTIERSVTLSAVRDLDFGRIIAPQGGRVDMTAEDTPTCTPNNGLTPIDPCQSAAFEGSAAAGFQVRISVPSGRRINLTGPDRDLRLRRMTVGAGDGVTFLGRTNRHFDFLVTDMNGDFTFYVAGRLLIRNNQAPGLYTGTFLIEADYQ